MFGRKDRPVSPGRDVDDCHRLDGSRAGLFSAGSAVLSDHHTGAAHMRHSSTRCVVRVGMVLAALVNLPGLAERKALAQPAAASPRGEMLAVTSKDGTRIGVECAGTGPTLLFVHGGVGDHTRWTPMFPLLASTFTVCAMDRRGRGASGDSPEYSLGKEAEDVAAVVNSRPGPVLVFGPSY